MKNLLNLEGAKPLGKMEQQSVNGGWSTDGGPCGSSQAKLLHCDPTCHCEGIMWGNCCYVCI